VEFSKFLTPLIMTYTPKESDHFNHFASKPKSCFAKAPDRSQRFLSRVYPESAKPCFDQCDTLPLRSDLLWRIERGVVRTLTWHSDGTPVVLGYWCAGDVVGQPLSRLCPYEMLCLTEVEVSALPAHLWNQSLEAVFVHLQQIEELHSINRTASACKRLQRFLGWLARKFGYKTEQGWLIDLRLTHQDIAEAIGMSRVTVTRLLNLLKQKKQIICDRGRLILLKNNKANWLY
jgi:CRP-like cAMP-binding protein